MESSFEVIHLLLNLYLLAVTLYPHKIIFINLQKCNPPCLSSLINFTNNSYP